MAGTLVLPKLVAPADAGRWFPANADLALADRVAMLDPDTRVKTLTTGDGKPIDPDTLLYDFRFWGRPSQLCVYDSSAHITAMISGRGGGKTRSLSEVAHHLAEMMPGSRGALIARTAADVRDTLIRGDSGIIETAHPDARPRYVANNRSLTWPNGTTATSFSAQQPDGLRGPQFNWALCIAAGQKVRVERGFVPIEDVTSDDKVLVRDGRYVPLRQGARLTRRRTEVIRIATATRTLDLTPDHRVATPEGWVEARELRPGDTILTCQIPTQYPVPHQAGSPSMTSDGTSGKSSITTPIEKVNSFIEKSGNRSMGRFQKAWSFITKTMIRRTTGSAIWNSEPMTITDGITRQYEKTKLGSSSTRLKPDRPTPGSSGMRVEKIRMSASASTAGKFIHRLAWSRFSVLLDAGIWLDLRHVAVSMPRRSHRNALVAAKSSLRRAREPNTAPIDANGVSRTGNDLNFGSLKTIASARSAAPAISAIAGPMPSSVQPIVKHETLVSVDSAPRQDVYDLTTSDPDFPEFFASGILVHNCDEVAAWPTRPPSGSIANAWDNVKLATRLGNNPQIFVATTPRRVPVVIELLNATHADPSKCLVVRGSTMANRHLAQVYRDTVVAMYAGTTLAQQELEGELLGDIDGALLTMDKISRVSDPDEIARLQDMNYLRSKYPVRIVGVDPSTSDKPRDECGIVVVAATAERNPHKRKCVVLADESLHGSPGVWAARVAEVAREYEAFVVVEDNQGGEMVRMVIRAHDEHVPVVLARSDESKVVRAEPVVLAFEKSNVRHLDFFGELETQWTSWVPDESLYSPDRLDASVIAISASLVAQPSGMGGRIRVGSRQRGAAGKRKVRGLKQHEKSIASTPAANAFAAAPRIRYVKQSPAEKRRARKSASRRLDGFGSPYP